MDIWRPSWGFSSSFDFFSSGDFFPNQLKKPPFFFFGESFFWAELDSLDSWAAELESLNSWAPELESLNSWAPELESLNSWAAELESLNPLWRGVTVEAWNCVSGMRMKRFPDISHASIKEGLSN